VSPERLTHRVGHFPISVGAGRAARPETRVTSDRRLTDAVPDRVVPLARAELG